MSVKRCSWVDCSKLLDMGYHDKEWGVPVTRDNSLFEQLTLEGAQAGLSWSTVLKKRECYRVVFHQFSIVKVSLLLPSDIDVFFPILAIFYSNIPNLGNVAKLHLTVGLV